MTHANAPLSVEGRRRLAERCKTRPIAHVAAATGISLTTASRWVNRHRHASRRCGAPHMWSASPPSSESSPTTVPATVPTHSLRPCSGRATSGSPRTRPDTTGRWRYNRILAEEVVYARAWVSEDQRREALAIRNIHYDFHRPTAPLMENRLRRGYAKASVMSWPPAPGLRRDSRNSGLLPPPLPPEVRLRYWHRAP
jgi:hypothetical protein